MGWLDNVGGYPIDDSRDILNQEREILLECQAIIKELTGEVRSLEDILNTDCEECLIWSKCPLLHPIREGVE